jgi:hypothetical protein
MTDETDVPRPASNELHWLAVKARPDWSPDAIRDALAAAHFSGMTWPSVLAAMGRLMADPQAEPPDLLAEARESWRHRRPPQDAETYQRGAAAVRAALHHTDTDT